MAYNIYMYIYIFIYFTHIHVAHISEAKSNTLCTLEMIHGLDFQIGEYLFVVR